MSAGRLILRSLLFYWRTHLGVIAGAAVATAVLAGALLVGDSVRHSLRRMALERLGQTRVAMQSADRYFTADLARALGSTLQAPTAPALELSGLASVPGGERRANDVHVIGADHRFWSIGDAPDPFEEAGTERGVALSRRLADRLEVSAGGSVILRVAKPSALSRDLPLGAQAEQSLAMRIDVVAVVPDERFGRFSLNNSQIPPLNAFVPLSLLQRKAELEGRANTLLIGPSRSTRRTVTAEAANRALERPFELADARLELRDLPDRGVYELRSERVFLDPPAVEAAEEAAPGFQRQLTYFVYELRSGERATPYSMVTALRPPADPTRTNPLPAGMADGQIVVTEWLADDLNIDSGDEVALAYPVLGPNQRVERRSASFTVAKVVPTEPPGGDRNLMPQFPGLAGVDSVFDWSPPPALEIDLKRVREKDERYWDEHRGAPKAFVSLQWSRAHWGSRFGELTSLRWDRAGHDRDRLARKIEDALDPARLGFFFRPVRETALRSSQQGTDFGGLFIGLSMFLVVAAMVLTALLFAFGVEQRSSESGTLLAVGWTRGRLRWLRLAEGLVLAALGAAVGLGLAVAYTKGVLWALTTLWREAVGMASLRYDADAMTLVIGGLAGVLVAQGSMAWVLWRQGRQPVRALLAARFGQHTMGSSASRPLRPLLAGGLCLVAGLGLVGWALSGQQRAAGVFFGAGALLLVAGLCGCAALLRASGRSRSLKRLTLGRLGYRNSARRRGRSLATIAILACGVFLIASVNAFRKDAQNNAQDRDAGTGGFALYAETSLPVHADLTTSEGRQRFALDESVMQGVSMVPMRLRGGDNASCLNLNRPSNPALLGVDPQALAKRDAFTFASAIGGAETESPWKLLSRNAEDPDAPVPAIVDHQVATYILKKGIGDTIEYRDQRGRTFEVKIVATLSNTILQGRLLIGEQQFTERFPMSGGHRVFLVDAPPGKAKAVRRELERAMADYGLTARPAAERLAMFNAVQNTYLSIFGVLGGLGLILGCLGLGLVVLRNVLERRGELALLRAVGFGRARLRWLLLAEHWGLLALGLLVGVASAGVAISPALRRPGLDAPVLTIALVLLGVIASGLAWTALAAAAALRGPLLDALRSE